MIVRIDLQSSLDVRDPDLAREVDRAVTAWELLRLRRYAGRPGNPCAIAIQPIGGGMAFRFPEVGYFNHARGVAIIDDGVLRGMTAFYAGHRGTHRVHLAVGAVVQGGSERLVAAGYRCRGEADVWLAAGRLEPQGLPSPAGLAVESLDPGNAEEFFATYLAGFGAAQPARPAAVENMRLLAGLPGLHGLLVRAGGEPVAIGMLHVEHGVGFLCAGSVLEPWKRVGIQRWLVDRRVEIARDLGCDLVVSWASMGGESHRNLERAGLRTVAVDDPWLYDPRGVPPDAG